MLCNISFDSPPEFNVILFHRIQSNNEFNKKNRSPFTESVRTHFQMRLRIQRYSLLRIFSFVPIVMKLDNVVYIIIPCQS